MKSALYRVSKDYLDFMEFEILKGRSFNPALETDQGNIVINEYLAKQFSWDDPIGQQVMIDTFKYTVIGMVRDFQSADFFDPSQATLFRTSSKKRI